MTPALRVLKQHNIEFTTHEFQYIDKGGTSHSSATLGVSEHTIIKTLIMQDADKKPLCILMHGDCEVSTKALARHLNTKSITPCNPNVAEKHSGYQVGGTSPFGLRTTMPIYVEDSVLDLPRILINGGGRGFLVAIDPKVLKDVLNAQPVLVAQPKSVRS